MQLKCIQSCLTKPHHISSQERKVSSKTSPENWLKEQIEKEEQKEDVYHSSAQNKTSFDTIKNLKTDQKTIAATIFNTIKQWLTTDNYTSFKPLRMIINGAGGSGKSVLINTVVNTMRRMFKCNKVVKVVAPTGAAAANINGETFHRTLNIAVSTKEYEAASMTQQKRMELVRKFDVLLALICDERSLLSSKILGTAEQKLSETIYNGFLKNQQWGGLPIFILVGDDYQLPSIEEGAFTALLKTGGNKMVQKGRMIWKECGKNVYDLQGNKRLNEGRDNDRELMSRLRKGGNNLTDADVEKLLNLRLETIQERHGKGTVDTIKENAIYLFFTNQKRIQHNLEMLVKKSSPDNPVAIIKRKSQGPVNGMSIKSHFMDSKNDEGAALLCVGCNVAIESRNFMPSWGLYSRAGGTIDEIVFTKGANPNKGHMPKYVVVHFPEYTGPAWDLDNPKVSNTSTHKYSAIQKVYIYIEQNLKI